MQIVWVLCIRSRTIKKSNFDFGLDHFSILDLCPFLLCLELVQPCPWDTFCQFFLLQAFSAVTLALFPQSWVLWLDVVIRNLYSKMYALCPENLNILVLIKILKSTDWFSFHTRFNNCIRSFILSDLLKHIKIKLIFQQLNKINTTMKPDTPFDLS